MPEYESSTNLNSRHRRLDRIWSLLCLAFMVTLTTALYALEVSGFNQLSLYATSLPLMWASWEFRAWRNFVSRRSNMLRHNDNHIVPGSDNYSWSSDRDPDDPRVV